MLHNLEAIAISVHYDCLHPAFKPYYSHISNNARAAVEHFRSHRASFITNDIALEDARRSLEDAAKKVRSLLARYRFLEELVKEWRGKPPIGEKFEKEPANTKWVYGVVPTDAGDSYKVSLTDGTSAFQGKMESKIRNIVPFTHNSLQFECRETLASEMDPTKPDPSICIVEGISGFIVGWTLSIRTNRPGPKSFSVKSGGILEDNLEIDITVPTFQQADCRCRVYYVDNDDYDFPHLTSR